jgi:DNA-binding PadR family transcriptional regulator
MAGGWHRKGMAARPVPVNATAAAILGLLHDGPLTGGELVAAAGERFGGFFSVTRSQVYRELPALAEAGLLRLGKLGPRASQQYRINAAGKRSFRAWLAGPGGADALRSPLVLRLLYAAELSVDDRAKLLATSRTAYTDRLKEAQEAVGAAGNPYERAVGEFTVAHLEAVLTLLDNIETAVPTEPGVTA